MRRPSKLTLFLSKIRIAIDYVLADNARNKRSFSIGISTVFLVVTFLRYSIPFGWLAGGGEAGSLE